MWKFLSGDGDVLFSFYKNFFGFIDSTAEDTTGNREREGERHVAKGPGPGVEPGSTAEPRRPKTEMF